jgi:hypothetical protein
MVRLAAGTVIGSAAILGVAITPSSIAKAAGRHSDPYCPPICFLRGTHIQTDHGPEAIENLRIGDLVMTHRGALEPIKWIGRMSYEKSHDKGWTSDVAPVKVAASAVSPGLPCRDLYLSQAHAIFDGEAALVPAVYLVNGDTLRIEAPANLQRLDYFQLEFEQHEIVFAEGLAVESFLARDADRERFSNFAEFARLYGPGATAMTPCYRVHSYEFGTENAVALLRQSLAALGLNVRDPVQAFHHKLRQRSKRLRREDATLPGLS